MSQELGVVDVTVGQRPAAPQSCCTCARHTGDSLRSASAIAERKCASASSTTTEKLGEPTAQSIGRAEANGHRDHQVATRVAVEFLQQDLGVLRPSPQAMHASARNVRHAGHTESRGTIGEATGRERVEFAARLVDHAQLGIQHGQPGVARSPWPSPRADSTRISGSTSASRPCSRRIANICSPYTPASNSGVAGVRRPRGPARQPARRRRTCPAANASSASYTWP